MNSTKHWTRLTFGYLKTKFTVGYPELTEGGYVRRATYLHYDYLNTNLFKSGMHWRIVTAPLIQPVITQKNLLNMRVVHFRKRNESEMYSKSDLELDNIGLT